MTEILAILVPALATALLQFLWQGALVGLLAWLALSLLRGARPQARYAVAGVALLACAVLPVWNLAHGLFEASPPLVQATTVTDMQAPVQAIASWIDAATTRRLVLADALMPWIVAAWALGAALLSLRLACAGWWLRGLRRDAIIEGDVWQACVDRLAPRFGITRRVEVRLCADGDTPMTAGTWRPLVLLPLAVVARMPAELLEALVAHELAHIRRHDAFVSLLQGAVEALLFYHPVVWWLSHRLRIERELVADDIAARVTGEPRQLAVALSELDRLAATRPPFPSAQLALAAHGGQLMSRIRQLVRPERRAAGTHILLPIVGLAAIATAFYAQARLAEPSAITPPVAQTIASAAATANATPASPALPAPQRSSAGLMQSVTTLFDGDDSPSYAIVRKGEDGIRMSGDLDDVDGIRAARRTIDDDFVWFRRDGKAWVIRDADTLAKVRQASRGTDAVSAEMRALEERMRPHSDRMSALGEQMQALHQDMEDARTPEMHAASERMQALSLKMQALAERQLALVQPMQAARKEAMRAEHEAVTDARRAELERQREAMERDLDAQRDALHVEQEALHREMEREHAVMEAAAARMEARAEPMEALSRQMGAASEPMESIGRQMEAVGERLEREAGIADAQIQQLIDDAYARGLASPAPSQQ